MDNRKPSHGCWIQVWEHDQSTRKTEVFAGPTEIPKLDAIGWGDEIDSLVIGPSAWMEAFEDENYSDTVKYFFPNKREPSMDAIGFGDEIDSLKIYNHHPDHFPPTP